MYTPTSTNSYTLSSIRFAVTGSFAMLTILSGIFLTSSVCNVVIPFTPVVNPCSKFLTSSPRVSAIINQLGFCFNEAIIPSE